MIEKAKELFFNRGDESATALKAGPRDKYLLTFTKGTASVTLSFEPRELWDLGSKIAKLGEAEFMANPREFKLDISKHNFVPLPPTEADEATQLKKHVRRELEDRGFTMNKVDRLIAEGKAKSRMEFLAEIVEREEALAEGVPSAPDAPAEEPGLEGGTSDLDG